MLIAENQLTGFQTGFKIIRFVGDAVHDFDPITNKFLVRDQEKVQRAKRNYPFAIGFIVVTLFQVIVATYTNQITMADFLQCVFVMATYLVVAYAQWSIITKRYQMEQIFNHMLDFENSQNGSKWKPSGVTGSLVAKLVRLTIFPFPFAILVYLGQILFLPCLPAHFGFFLLPQCSIKINSLQIFLAFPTIKLIYVVVVIIIMELFSGFSARVLFPGFIFDVTISYLWCYCISNYIKLYSRILNKISVHTKNFYGSVSTFRQIQIIMIEFNSYHQNYNSVVKIGYMVIGIDIGLYALVRLYDSLLVPQIITYMIAVIELFCVILFAYGLKACVYVASKQLLKDIKGLNMLNGHKWFRRYIRSWPVLKVYLGSVNFIDEVTPLRILDFAISQLVSLLLL
ncbi:unnamed protein product [Orchesella dallaii]|uniref:Odorant receptor n=1 Tax=Orchesella dallaii TaxID=48710 RepID=A0ABP1PKA8_9HEXA